MPERSCFYLADERTETQTGCFYDFKGENLTEEVLDELNYQFMQRLEKEGLITLKELYIDGTKIEAKLTLDNDTFENTGKSRFFERRTSRVLY